MKKKLLIGFMACALLAAMAGSAYAAALVVDDGASKYLDSITRDSYGPTHGRISAED